MKLRVVKRAKARGNVISFSLAYNEEWFLPHFLRHHRALGVEQFVFYDDHSTDRTLDILMEQDDCTVIASAEEERAPHRLGELQIAIGNIALEKFGRGAWALTLDLDEFVILPTGFSSIAEVARYLERQDLKCAMAVMVDFYPERLADRFFDPLPPLEGSPWFDRDPGFVRDPSTGEPRIAAAGVRTRLLKRLVTLYPRKIKEIYGDIAYRVPKMWKAALLKTGEGIVRTNAHTLNVQPSDQIRLALAHFKFYPGLDARVRDALDRQGYFQASVEYRFLDAILELFPNDRLIFPGSVEYRSPASLEQVGLTWAR